MLEELDKQLKIEYTIISRGTEKYGSKGYMGVSEKIDGKRFFVLSNHYDKYVNTYKDSFLMNDFYNIETITISRFELISRLAFKEKENFLKEKVLICGFGNVGFSALLHLLKKKIKKIDIFVKDNVYRYEKAVKELNNIFNSEITLLNEIGQYNTYIESTGSSEAIKHIIENSIPASSIFLLGTPRECEYLFNPLEIHRKNINIFGGHELNGYSWDERNGNFYNLLIENSTLPLKDYVSVYNAQEDTLIKVLNKKENFFEVIKYDI